MMKKMRVVFKEGFLDKKKARAMFFNYKQFLFLNFDGLSAFVYCPAGEQRYWKGALENNNIIERVELLDSD